MTHKLAVIASVIESVNNHVKGGRAEIGDKTLADIRAGLRDDPTRDALDGLLKGADTPPQRAGDI
ncbi:hypothetical protein PSP20601_04935 [Pandoraea sputorum]|nr:hypothetical protein PSP20601_04935 [Pandoraea sputorum]